MNRQPQPCTEDLSPEYLAYKQLIIDIAGDLHPEDIQSLAYTQDVTLLQNHNGLNLLSILEKRGKIGQLKINELSEMLRRINRNDLISSKIQPYQQKYKTKYDGRHQSFAGQSTNNPRLTPSKRANTFSEFGSTENILEAADSSSINNPLIQQETTGDSSTKTSQNTDLKLNKSHKQLLTIKNTRTSTPKFSMQESKAELPTEGDSDIPGDESLSFPPNGLLISHPDHYDFHSTSSGIEPFSKHSQSHPSFSDLSSTAAEVAGINNLQSRPLQYRERTQDDIHSLTTSEPPTSEHHFSYGDSDFPRQRTQRSASVAPTTSQYILINEELHQVPSFQLPFRSFTPPGSVPLQRERVGLYSPLAGIHNDVFRVASPQQQHDKGLQAQEFSLVSESANDIPQSTSAFTALTSKTIATSVMPTPVKPVVYGETVSTPSLGQVANILPPPSRPNLEHRTLDTNDPNSISRTMVKSVASLSNQSTSSSESTSKEASISSPMSTQEINISDDPAEAISPETSASAIKRETSKKPRRGSLKSKLTFRHKHYRESIQWTIKRHKLNKAIYKHEEEKTIKCKKKIEVDIGLDRILNPSLTFILHPYGLQEDKEQNATLVVHIEASKKAPILKDPSVVKLLLNVKAGSGSQELLNKADFKINLNSRTHVCFGIVSHEALRKSHSETILIEIKVDVELEK